MKARLLALAFLPAFLSTPLPAESTGEEAPPSKQVLQTALNWMRSSDPERRQAAYRSVHLLGEEALPGFEQALKSALKFHETRLSDVLAGRSGDGNPYRAFGAVAAELDTERPRVYALILTDYKKDPDKIRMLRTECDGVARLYERATKLSAADRTTIDKDVDAVALALAEIREELQRFESHHYGEELPESDRFPAERKREALLETFDGEVFLKDQARFNAFRGELDALAATESANAQMEWANSSQRDFATLLNRERAAIGLDAFLLEERLSDASTGHSTDMRTLGFFSHTSPVEGKASPGDRARLAGFTGGWSGENIFVGSASHTGAYSAWFGSDGHRFIMFAKGPNVLGLGPVGNHWTLMTGRK